MHTEYRRLNFKHPPQAHPQRIRSPSNISYSLCGYLSGSESLQRKLFNQTKFTPVLEIRERYPGKRNYMRRWRCAFVPQMLNRAKEAQPRKESTDDAHKNHHRHSRNDNRLIFDCVPWRIAECHTSFDSSAYCHYS